MVIDGIRLLGKDKQYGILKKIKGLWKPFRTKIEFTIIYKYQKYRC
jgi:hypothetical protein